MVMEIAQHAMEHIKHALAEREMSLFALRGREKGSREWSAFSRIREDHTSYYPVSQPQKPVVSRSGRILRIIPLPFPQRLELRGSH